VEKRRRIDSIADMRAIGAIQCAIYRHVCGWRLSFVSETLKAQSTNAQRLLLLLSFPKKELI
jgi:hypothetical protein